MNLKPVKDQVVVLVGATSGVGMETAIQFGRKGATIALVGRDQEELRNVLAKVKEAGGEGITITADVSQWDQVKSIADQVEAAYGRADTWVNLAAVSLYASFSSITPEEFKQIIDVNFMGQVYGAMAALPLIRKQGTGAILFVTSVEARVAMPLHSAYAASKHALDGFISSFRMELDHAEVPISITNIMPSSINTPFFSKSKTKLGIKPRPFPPVYEALPVARAIVYAAEHPVREMVIGSAGLSVQALHRISPRLAESVLTRIAFVAQQTHEMKSADAPSNLFGHVPGYNHVHGDFSQEARSFSLSTWLETHPVVRIGLTTSALGAASYFVVRSVIKNRMMGK